MCLLLLTPQKINRDRPTINALQKARKLAKKRKTFATPQNNKDHEAFAADIKEQLQAEAAVIAELLSSGNRTYEPTLFVKESEVSRSDKSELSRNAND
jgi:hypothetical protein